MLRLLFLLFVGRMLLGDAYSENAKRFVTIDGDYYLVGTSCEVLRGEVKNIRAWSQKMGAPVVTAPVLCEPHGKDDRGPTFRAAMKGSLPPLALQKVCRQQGPNCWNTALVSSGVLTSARFASDEEIKFWTESPLCKLIGPGQSRQTGDIVRIHTKEGDAHAMVYLADNLVFEKGGSGADMPYELNTLARQCYRYGVSDTCVQVLAAGSDGERVARFFRCRPRKEYMAEKTGWSPELVDLDKRIEAVAAQLQKIVFNKEHLPSPEGDAIDSEIAQLSAEVERQEKRRTADDDKWLARALAVQLRSMKEQTTLFSRFQKVTSPTAPKNTH